MGSEEGGNEPDQASRFIRRGTDGVRRSPGPNLSCEEHSVAESREIIIGHSDSNQLILVNFTGIDDRVRIFSARKATRRERKDYEENVGT